MNEIKKLVFGLMRLALGFVAVGQPVAIGNISWTLHQPDNDAANGQRQNQVPDKKHQADHQKIEHLDAANKLCLIAARHHESVE